MIARVSFVALDILEKVRQNQKRQGLDVSVAWTPEIQGVKAIEVYPAATLIAHGYWKRGSQSYKGKNDKEERQKIVGRLSRHFQSGIKKSHRDFMLNKIDALDAVVCILAALDFLTGDARGPVNGLERKRSEREGWIWFRRPKEDVS